MFMSPSIQPQYSTCANLSNCQVSLYDLCRLLVSHLRLPPVILLAGFTFKTWFFRGLCFGVNLLAHCEPPWGWECFPARSLIQWDQSKQGAFHFPGPAFSLSSDHRLGVEYKWSTCEGRTTLDTHSWSADPRTERWSADALSLITAFTEHPRTVHSWGTDPRTGRKREMCDLLFFRRFPGPGVLFGVRVSRALDQLLTATALEPIFSFFFPRW